MSLQIRRLAASFGFLMFAAVAASPAAPADGAPQRTITMPGEGIAKAAPDTAGLSTGVVSQGKTAAEALAANSRAMNAVFATLKRLGIADRNIQTSNFSLSPQYSEYKPGVSGPRHIAGYQVSNTVTVTVENLDKTGAVLDALVSSGSNQIGDIGFSIRDTSALLKQAREAAVKDATLRAETYAHAAGVTLGPILSINEGGNEGPRPVYRTFANKAKADAPPPIAGGEQSVTANVTIVWEIH